MKRIADCRLYGILDLGYVGPGNVARVTDKMLEGGVDILQLRAKDYADKDVLWFAEQIHPLTEQAGVPLIINDLPGVCAATGAEGVHVGQDDLAAEDAQRLAGWPRIVGQSTHSLAQATVAAARAAVSYIGFGPLFATPTKPDYQPIGIGEIRRVHEQVQLPIFCIGGIKLENLEAVIAAGARRVVIVSGILLARDIASYVRAAKAMLPPA